MKNILFIAGFVLIAFMYSCNKNNTHEVHISSDLLSHFSVKPGTYWIYKDSITGRTDSFFVRSNSFSSIEQSYYYYDHNSIMMAEFNIDGTAIPDSSLWDIELRDSAFDLLDINKLLICFR